MGAAASIPLKTATARDVANYVNSIGESYSGYAALLLSNGIDGEFLASSTENDLETILKEIILFAFSVNINI